MAQTSNTSPDRAEYFRQWHLKNRNRRLVRNRERYIANREQRLKESAIYRNANPEVSRRSSKKYARTHREECRRRNRDWYNRHIESERARSRAERRAAYAIRRDEILARNRLWRAANKEKIRNRDMRRRARVASALLGNPQLIIQWMTEIRKQKSVRCYWCGTKLPGRKVHFDHVQSIASGGAHSISNLCASCPECNLSKQAKSAARWDRHPQLFLSL